MRWGETPERHGGAVVDQLLHRPPGKRDLRHGETLVRGSRGSNRTGSPWRNQRHCCLYDQATVMWPTTVERGTVSQASFACRCCGSQAVETVLDLGRQPSWDHMPPADAPLPDPLHPLRMGFCRDCHLAQLIEDVDGIEEIPAVESVAMLNQAERTLARVSELGLLAPGVTVAEFPSPHSAPWMPQLVRQGLVEQPDGPARLVIDVYGLLHEPDQDAALRRRIDVLAPDGTLVLQFRSLATTLRERQWTDLRHGHQAYWSLPALDRVLRRFGLGVHRAWWYPFDAGTVVAAATRNPEPDPETQDLLRKEVATGVIDPERLRDLQRAASSADRLREWLERERAEGRRVAGYGAASRAVPLIYRAGLDASLLAAIGDASPARHGRRMPGTDIPIISPDELVAMRPDRVVVFIPDLIAEVRAALPSIEDNRGRWVVVDPEPRLVELSDDRSSALETDTAAQPG